MTVDHDVLIVGGGPVGLCSSLALSRLGVSSLLVERHPGTALHPKATHLSVRTTEVFRAWGIADDIRAIALPPGDHALFQGRSLADPDHLRQPIWQPDPTVGPESTALVSQEVLEPELRRLAEQAGPGEVRFGTRLTELYSDGDGVVAELTGGARVRARYVIGADGADSTVRAIAGIAFPGHVVHRSVNLRFRADLRALVADRRSCMYYVQNDEVRGLIPVVDNAVEWRLHLVMGPEETLADYEQAQRRLALVRAAVGVPDLEVELLPIYDWTAASRVAERYRAGRLFLAGDAAHVHPPNGGLGMNCGIQDVHNLTWKLAAVLRGAADPALLDSYDVERRPVGERTAREAERNHVLETALRRSAQERQQVLDRRRQLGLILGQHYADGAFTPDGTPPPQVVDPYVDYVPTARPGHRAPHLWLERDRTRISTLDLLAWEHPTLLVGPAAGGWRAVAAATHTAAVTVGGDEVRDPAGAFQMLYGIGPEGAVLVRQDGIVAMRAPGAPVDLEQGSARLRHRHGVSPAVTSPDEDGAVPVRSG